MMAIGNHLQCFIIISIVLALLAGCDGDNQSIEIRADGWPDGSIISLITGDTVAGRTPVYGSRASLTPPPGEFQIRAAYPSMLTAITDTIVTGEGAPNIELPAPVERRRFGSWRIGIGFNHPEADSLAQLLCDQSPLAFTTLTIDRSRLMLVRSAHSVALECLMTPYGGHLATLAEDAERAGYDGIIANYGSIMNADEPASTYDILRESTRERGITLVVSAEIRSTDGNVMIEEIAAWFTVLQSGGRPDELRLVFRGDADMPVVSAEWIEESAARLAARGVPLGMISIDLAPAAAKYRVTPDGSLVAVESQRGEVAFLFAIVSGTPGVRLRDGSLRIGNRGDFFVIEDIESIVQKIARLRSGPLSSSAGIHLICDEYGILIGPGEMRRIADAVTRAEAAQSY